MRVKVTLQQYRAYGKKFGQVPTFGSMSDVGLSLWAPLRKVRVARHVSTPFVTTCSSSTTHPRRMEAGTSVVLHVSGTSWSALPLVQGMHGSSSGQLSHRNGVVLAHWGQWPRIGCREYYCESNPLLLIAQSWVCVGPKVTIKGKKKRECAAIWGNFR